MPIVNMTSKPEEAPAGAVNLRDATKIYNVNFPLWLYDTHVGLCIKEREANFYDDSDFYMTVWNFEKNAPEEICFGTTRGWSYPTLGSRVDATPDVMALYRGWEIEEGKKNRAAAAAREASEPRKGKTLRVVKGRKVPKGTVGVCIWRGTGTYGERVGIKDAAGTVHWTAMSNVEVVPESTEVAGVDNGAVAEHDAEERRSFMADMNDELYKAS